MKKWFISLISLIKKVYQDFSPSLLPEVRENMNETDALIQAHKYCINHKSSIMKDKLCGCFYCLEIFSPTEISSWIDDTNDKTALCPYCGIDSVFGESSGFPITLNFLKKMNSYWF